MATDQCDVSNRVSGESEGVQKKATEKGERGGLDSKKEWRGCQVEMTVDY